MSKNRKWQEVKWLPYFSKWALALLILVNTIVVTLHAQVIPLPKAILKTIPSTLIDPDNTLTLGLEVPLTNRWSVQQEVGWGHNSFNVYSSEREEYPNRQTWRFRSQIRYYFSDISSPNGSFFIALEYFRKNVLTDQIQSVGRDCDPLTGACAYFQVLPVRINRQVSAGHFKWGYAFSTQSKITIEIYMGLGIRSLIVKDNSGRTMTNIFRNRFLTFRPDTPGNYGTMPGVSAGIALGYAFRPRKPKSLSLPY
ncbi:DUF3575 domain-containing protein [Runella sp.]|uniref:DUF3575 domain-containing protein n=1 Tax=Runella sp. TaxID=1960881 RepID=UPI003D0BAC96